MGKCHTCGHQYEHTFEIIFANQKYSIDCFESAISALAPSCQHCECRIIGRGVESQRVIYCCANCASADGVTGMQDHSA